MTQLYCDCHSLNFPLFHFHSIQPTIFSFPTMSISSSSTSFKCHRAVLTYKTTGDSSFKALETVGGTGQFNIRDIVFEHRSVLSRSPMHGFASYHLIQWWCKKYFVRILSQFYGCWHRNCIASGDYDFLGVLSDFDLCWPSFRVVFCCKCNLEAVNFIPESFYDNQHFLKP